jgi:hypothetical protein
VLERDQAVRVPGRLLGGNQAVAEFVRGTGTHERLIVVSERRAASPILVVNRNRDDHRGRGVCQRILICVTQLGNAGVQAAPGVRAVGAHENTHPRFGAKRVGIVGLRYLERIDHHRQALGGARRLQGRGCPVKRQGIGDKKLDTGIDCPTKPVYERVSKYLVRRAARNDLEQAANACVELGFKIRSCDVARREVVPDHVPATLQIALQKSSADVKRRQCSGGIAEK